MIVTKPFFSIIIPTYNRAHLIGGTLQSVLAQSNSSFEIIVIDDGGKDNTEEVVQLLKSDQIKYFHKENSERGAARNFGWQKSKGDFVTFLDSDDILYPDHLQKAYDFLAGSNIICYAQAYEVKNAKTGEVLTKGYATTEATINNQILKGNFLSCFGVFLKRELMREVQFEEERRFAGTEDWLLWLQLAARYPFYFNNYVTGALLEHDMRSVLSFKEESLVFRTEFLRKRLEEDSEFVKQFGRSALRNIYAHMLTYTSLHLAMSRKKADACRYWIKALSVNANELLTKRSLAITKKILFS